MLERRGTWNADGTILFAPASDSRALMRSTAGGTRKTSPDSIRRGRLAINRPCSCPMAATFSCSQWQPVSVRNLSRDTGRRRTQTVDGV